MPFRSGNKPVIKASVKRLKDLIFDLMKAGYEEHAGRKVRLRKEIATLRKRFKSNGKNRQCHIQIVCDDEHTIKVYAHTEPDMKSIIDVLMHGYSAIMDQANYQAGSRMLLNDLPKWRTNKRS